MPIFHSNNLSLYINKLFSVFSIKEDYIQRFGENYPFDKKTINSIIQPYFHSKYRSNQIQISNMDDNRKSNFIMFHLYIFIWLSHINSRIIPYRRSNKNRIDKFIKSKMGNISTIKSVTKLI